LFITLIHSLKKQEHIEWSACAWSIALHNNRHKLATISALSVSNSKGYNSGHDGERLFLAVDKELNKQFRLFLRLKLPKIKNLRLEINGLKLHRK